jgi:tRNA A-37 threonylcarbamoyl transferase component Bud32
VLATDGFSPPGYEIIEELGRGGMGVVYKARQVKLNRTVALKMILAGRHAGAADLQRFRTEAEAIARLRHPNIVAVYEVGEHEGRPFLSLEFCEGGSLDRKLAGNPLPPQKAAALVQTLAEAMQAAHQANVIHRDLKPANVMLGGDGTPRITDFGLARKLDEVGQTQTGAIMGTPSYMAPEQAESKKDVGPAADVYALGAILYQTLTGRPPFRAATTLDTIIQVVSDEPVPPRQLNATVPVDLETVCLRCLQKDPRRRYASAAELAQDLGRFLAGEPVLARPVGSLERVGKWARRNPAVAGLLAAVAAALLLGVAVSGFFAIDASRQASQARLNEEAALKNAEQARDNETRAMKARQELETSNDRLLTSVARSVLRPLAAQRPRQGVPRPGLSDPEIEGLTELRSPEEQLCLRFIEEALLNPGTTQKLKYRAAYALHAAVGLDTWRRARVEQLLAERMKAKQAPAQQKDIALALAHLGGADRGVSAALAEVLAGAMSPTTNASSLCELAEGLAVVSARMEPKEAAVVSTRAAACLTQAMHKTTVWTELAALAEGLAAVAPRTERKEAAQAAATVAQAMMTRTTNSALRTQLTQALVALAARMEPKQAAEVSGRVAATLAHDMSTTADLGSLWSPAMSLAVVAERMEPKEAAAVSARAAASLIQAVGKSTDSITKTSLSNALSAVAGRMEPKEAVSALTQAMSKTTDLLVFYHLARALTAAAARMEAKEAAAACARAADILTQAMNKITDQGELAFLSNALSAVAARMEPKEAVSFLTQAMSKTTDRSGSARLAESLVAVAGRMEPKEAVATCTQAAACLTQALNWATDRSEQTALAEGLAVVAARKEPKEAARAAAALVRAVTRTTNAYALTWLAQNLAEVAADMEPKEAAVTCAPAAAHLTQAMRKTVDAYTLSHLAKGLAAVTAPMEPKEAADLCAWAAHLTLQHTSKTDSGNREFPFQCFSEVLSRQSTTTRQHSAGMVAALIGLSGANPLLVTPALLRSPRQPPAPLRIETLVELLKHPLCVGEARRAVLDQVQRHYQRPFVDQWDFVRFAQERQLGLEFTNPPQPSR